MKEYEIKTKVCIVGSGFCGYAAYNKLKSCDVDLILVEGGKEKTPQSDTEQNYYKVFTNKLISFSKKFKIKSKLDPSFRDRKFTLGGSSECWTGWIKPFEKSTYENYYIEDKNQSWGNLRLDQYEKEVLELLKSPINDFNVKKIANKLNLNLPKLHKGLNYSGYAWAKENVKLKKYWLKKINRELVFNESKNKKDLIVGYKLFDFLHSNGKIKCLKFIDESINSRLNIEADYFLLCMGGIENAKFVNKIIDNLNLKDSISQYIGNFQEHPHLYNIAHFNKGSNTLPKILTEKINISNKVHSSFRNGTIKLLISAWDGPGSPKVTFSVNKNKQNKLTNGIKNFIRMQLGKEILPNSDYLISMRCEQTKHQRSKLSFESKKTYLNWKIKDSDFIYYSEYLKKLGSFLISNKFAKDFSLTSFSKNNYAIPNQIYGGAHHMSTVPFLKNKLLINEKFQLSALKNIYIVGSSAFPVSGFENPTHAAMATSLVATEDIIRKINKNL